MRTELRQFARLGLLSVTLSAIPGLILVVTSDDMSIPLSLCALLVQKKGNVFSERKKKNENNFILFFVTTNKICIFLLNKFAFFFFFKLQFF